MSLDIKASVTHSLAVEWIAFAIAIAVTSFALGLLVASVLLALLAAMSPVLLMPVGVSCVLLGLWARELIGRTREAERAQP